MMYEITYTMLIGTSRRDAATAGKALNEVMSIKLAGGSNIVIQDKDGRVISQRELGERYAVERPN